MILERGSRVGALRASAGAGAQPPRIDKALLSRRFGRAAGRYQRHAHLQARAAAELMRAARLRMGPGPAARILDVGCGTGLLTAHLLDAWPGAEVVGLDLAEGMVEEARRRLSGRGARFVLGDVEAGFPAGPFDLVASSMALQWAVDPAAVLRGAAGQLASGGTLAVAVPVAGTLPELRAAYEWAARALDLDRWRYPGPAFHPAERWGSWAGAVFEEVHASVEILAEHHPDARALLESIRGVGANDCGGGAGSAAVPLLRRALAHYDRRFRAGAGVVATWRLGILVARRPRRIGR